MLKLAAIVIVSLSVLPIVHADIPSKSPEQRAEQYATRTLAIILRQISEMDAIVVADGPDKDKNIAARADIKAKIDAQLKDMQPESRALLFKHAAEQEASLTAQLNDAKDPAEKAKLSDALKPYKTFNDLFKQASLEFPDSIIAPKDGPSNRMIFAGLALGLAFASGGILYARKSSSR